MGKTQIERAQARVGAATSMFKQAHDELEAANEQLRRAQDFHQEQSRQHAEHARTAKQSQVANNAVLDTLRTLIPST